MDADRDFLAQVRGYGLMTAEISYFMPDHPALIQLFVWQDYDLAPRFPELNRFLAFWERTLEGPLFRVTVAHKKLISAAELKVVDGEFRLN